MEASTSLMEQKMNALIRITLLLSLASPVYAEQFIRCESPGFSDILESGWPLTIMVLAFLASALWCLFNEYRDRSWIICLALSCFFGGVLFFTAPTSLPVVDKEAILSQPDIAKGRHYQNDCVRVYQTDTTATLSCKPDGRTVTVPKTEYDSAVLAFAEAEIQLVRLKRRLPNNNICSAE